MKLLLFFFIISITNTVLAQIDYNVENVIRSYPLGLYSAATIGNGTIIWGEKNKSPMYGFIRPSLTYQTSVLVNSARGEIGIHPVSFAGVYFGRDYTSRQINVPTFDCDQVICKGKLERNYWGAKMALTYKTLILMINGKMERIEMYDKVGPFADERTSLVARSGYDYVSRVDLFLGYKLNDNWTSGLLLIDQNMKYQINNSTMNYLFGKYKKSDSNWEYIWGMGSFKTRLDHNVFSTIISIKWWGDKGLLLF